MAKEIPVYIFTGFMDSGKTTLIQETLLENDFSDGNDKILIICCEDGDTEYDESRLKTVNASVEMLENEVDYKAAVLEKLVKKHEADIVFVEYNGTWSVDHIYDELLPAGWMIAQSIATVDATTFENYLANMRTMMMEQLFRAEVVIFNRCTDSTPKAKFRGQIKSMNRPAQIVYEREDSTVDDSADELPFDISGDEIEITDADYALWFMDCMENPKKYNGKTVHYLGLVYNPPDKSLGSSVFVSGRFAMTCCVEDIQFLGMKCKWDKANTLGHRSWIDIKAKIKVEFAKEYRGKGPVLYPVEIKEAKTPEDALVYFS